MIWLILAIALWGAVHSWLASLEVKGSVRQRLGDSAFRAYRLFYNIFSVLTFAPLLLLVGLLPDRVLYVVEAPWRYVMLAAQGAAVVGLLIAFRQTDALAFLGLKQLTGQQESAALVTGGLYRYMRHPMYFFGLLIIWLTPAMTANLLVAYLALSAYLLVGAWFEERKLARIFGEKYLQYRLRTPMILPLPLLRRKPA